MSDQVSLWRLMFQAARAAIATTSPAQAVRAMTAAQILAVADFVVPEEIKTGGRRNLVEEARLEERQRIRKELLTQSLKALGNG